MQSVSFAQRARSYMRPPQSISSDPENERNEVNELISRPSSDQLASPDPASLAGLEFPPLDRVIARKLAHKHTVEQIQARIDHSRQMVEQFPGWAPYSVAVGDWTAILAIKVTPASSDGTLDDDQHNEEETDEWSTESQPLAGGQRS